MGVSDVSVKCYGGLGNNAVIQMPGRNFPAVAMQGDTLSNLLSIAKTVKRRAVRGKDDELTGEAELLVDLLESIHDHYVHVLAENGIAAPTSRP